MKRVLLAVAFLVLAVTSAPAQENGKVYRFKNRMTDKFLSLDDTGEKAVQQSNKPDETSQRWKLVAARGGKAFQIINEKSGKALVVPSKEATAQIQLRDAASEKPKRDELWTIEKGVTNFKIKSQLSGLYLEVFNFEREDGVPITQQTLNDSDGRGNQIWELVPVE